MLVQGKTAACVKSMRIEQEAHHRWTGGPCNVKGLGCSKGPLHVFKEVNLLAFRIDFDDGFFEAGCPALYHRSLPELATALARHNLCANAGNAYARIAILNSRLNLRLGSPKPHDEGVLSFVHLLGGLLSKVRLYQNVIAHNTAGISNNGSSRTRAAG